jgi:ubiquinone/menaquinone biosynthesis C-methylase UbiE
VYRSAALVSDRILRSRHGAAHESAQRQLNAFAVQQLQLTSSDRVLEVGFGGGVTLRSLIAGAAFVSGVDRSRDMVSRAKARFSEAVKAGRAEFREGDLEHLPFQSSSFGKVCIVNTVYF